MVETHPAFRDMQIATSCFEQKSAYTEESGGTKAFAAGAIGSAVVS